MLACLGTLSYPGKDRKDRMETEETDRRRIGDGKETEKRWKRDRRYRRDRETEKRKREQKQKQKQKSKQSEGSER